MSSTSIYFNLSSFFSHVVKTGGSADSSLCSRANSASQAPHPQSTTSLGTAPTALH